MKSRMKIIIQLKNVIYMISGVTTRSAQWFGRPFRTNIRTYRDRAAYYIDTASYTAPRVTKELKNSDSTPHNVPKETSRPEKLPLTLC